MKINNNNTPPSVADYQAKWGARGVMAIVVGNWHGDTSSKPGQDWLHVT